MRILDPEELIDARSWPMPAHIAVIMDGNRRWGHARGIPPVASHAHSAPALASAIRAGHDLGIRHLTFFCLSADNLQRPQEEVAALLKFEEWLWPATVIDELTKVNARVELAGDIDDERIRENLPRVITQFSTPTPSMTVTFALNYGSRQEMERAASRRDSARPSLAENLYLPNHPSIDVLVRTAGEQRLSNFMLWQSAFAELVFTDTLWPDFTGLHLASVVREYLSRHRKLGR